MAAAPSSLEQAPESKELVLTEKAHESVSEPASESAPAEEAPKYDIDPENEIKGASLLILHCGLCLCMFLMGLDFNLIATAIPSITSEFHTIEDVGWYGAAYFITLCAATPFAGKTYTIFPMKTTFLTWMAAFEVGSLICALAPTSKALIAGRVFNGLGGAGIASGGLVILTTITPLHKRAAFTGTLNATFVIASVVGPVIAGAFTQHVTWRWCFWINLPVGGAAALAIIFLLHLKHASDDISLTQKLKKLDGLGFTLFSGSIVMLLLALQWGGSTYPWRSSVVIGLFIGFGLTAAVFIAWEIRLQDNAMIPPRLFTTHRNAWIISMMNFFSNGPFQIVIYYLPIWFQAAQGVSPTDSGVRFLATAVPDVLTSLTGAGMIQMTGIWNPAILLGATCMSVGGGLLSTMYVGISERRWIGYQILGGIGYSLVTTTGHIGMQASLPQDLVPLGATNVLFWICLSGAVFLAIGQAVFQGGLSANLAQVVPDDVAQAVITAGATRIRSVVSPGQLDVVVQAYSKAITQVFYITAAAPVISFLVALGLAWVRIEKPKKEDTEAARSSKNDALEQKKDDEASV